MHPNIFIKIFFVLLYTDNLLTSTSTLLFIIFLVSSTFSFCSNDTFVVIRGTSPVNLL